MGQIMRVGGFARVHKGKFGRDRLAHDDRALFLETLNDKGVAQWYPPRIARASVFCRNAQGIDHVFQSHRKPVQTAQRQPCTALCVQRFSLRAHEICIEPSPRADLGLAGFDPFDIAFDQDNGIQRTGCQPITQ